MSPTDPTPPADESLNTPSLKGDPTMILKIHVRDAEPYYVGDEIWHCPLEEAIAAEARTIAEDAGSDLIQSPEDRERLREQVTGEMTRALTQVGDRYLAPDGILYSLIDESGDDEQESTTIGEVPAASPTVQRVVRFEDLPVGSLGSRRAIVRWSDGTRSEALTWYADEMLSPVNRVGRALKRADAGESAA